MTQTGIRGAIHIGGERQSEYPKSLGLKPKVEDARQGADNSSARTSTQPALPAFLFSRDFNRGKCSPGHLDPKQALYPLVIGSDQENIKVAANLADRPVTGKQLRPGYSGQFARYQTSLDLCRPMLSGVRILWSWREILQQGLYFRFQFSHLERFGQIAHRAQL